MCLQFTLSVHFGCMMSNHPQSYIGHLYKWPNYDSYSPNELLYLADNRHQNRWRPSKLPDINHNLWKIFLSKAETSL